MSISRGTQLGPYEIVDSIGAGGMGEVWRARDTRLDRDVAIKVLPAGFAENADFIQRFEREAKAISSLNHPHICTLHDVGQDDGTHYLVMELIDGESLAERLSKGPLPLHEVLKYGRQIASALDSAHRRGVIHRDLKPGNIMLTKSGAKLLDFGLAKTATEGPAPIEGLTNLPTAARRLTQEGTILGTFQYMAPEQLEGMEADARTDIFAFGAVLYEMATGHRAFRGETKTSLIASIVASQPEPISSFVSMTPPALDHVVRRCLEKNPDDRWQSAQDIAGELQWISETGAQVPVQAPTKHRPALAIIGFLAGAAVAAIAGLLWSSLSTRPPETEGETMRIEVPLPQGTRIALNHQHDVIAISSDGKLQAMIVQDSDGQRRLAVRDLSDLQSRVLPGTEGASTPFFSPDDQSIGFFANGRLLSCPVSGGPLALITERVGDDRGAAWSPDGFIYAAPSSSLPLQRVRSTGGQWEDATRLDEDRQERTHRWPHVLPGGKAVLFTSDTMDTSEYYDDARIEALNPLTGERKVVVEQSSRAWYLQDGYLLFARGGALFAAPFDLDDLTTTGAPVLVLNAIATTVASGAVHLSVARNGTLLYLAGDFSRAAANIVWVERDERREPTGIEGENFEQIALSPDGGRLALVSGDSGARVIWLIDLERGTRARLTFGSMASNPRWSPDGEWIYYQREEGLHRKRADGSGGDELLVESRLPINPESVSTDGRTLIFAADTPSGQSDIFALDLEERGTPTPLVQTEAIEWMAALSPDSRWLAYVSYESGRPEVYVRSMQDRDGRWQISTGSGFEPRWSSDGDELFYRDGLGFLYSLPVNTSRTFSPGAPTRIVSGLRTGENPSSYAVSPDGSRFLALGLANEEELDRVGLILGWEREVERLTRPR